MNSNRFTELLNLYLDDNATVKEREELMQLISEGSHDDTIKDRIRVMLLDGSGLEEIDAGKKRKMLNEIIARDQVKVIPIWQAPTSWRWVAAAAVLVIAVTVGWSIFMSEPAPHQQVALQEKKPQPVIFSGKQFVRLPDGSTVLLNEGSELSYSISFGKQDRVVTLIGEGYFDVQHDSLKPFKVLTGNVTTTVLGTTFNVKAYPGQQEIKVTVIRGKVKVGNDKRMFGIITPDQQIAVNKLTNDFIQTSLKAESAEAWKNKYLILDNVSLEEAVNIISEKYGVKINLANEDLKKCRISATFLNGENLDQVLAVVCGVVDATYTMLSNDNAILEGAGCK